MADTPWVHLDIAGTAWTEKDSSWQMKGATGVMIRTLIGLCRKRKTDEGLTSKDEGPTATFTASLATTNESAAYSQTRWILSTGRCRFQAGR